MTKRDILRIIKSAIDLLYEKDALLLSEGYDIHERTITHKLAMYLEKFFQHYSYDVDVEYNRMRDEYGNTEDIGNIMGKRLNFEDSSEGSNFVYPDIIVHKRDQKNNLLEIEVKMAWKNQKKHLDFIKINEYIEQIGYKYGIYIELSEKKKDCKVLFGPFDLNNSISLSQ